MSYKSKFTGAEVDDLLQKVKEGASIEVDTSLDPYSMNPIANSAVWYGIERAKDDVEKMILNMVTIAPLSDGEAIKEAFSRYGLAKRLNTPIPCYIKENGFYEEYQSAILIVEDYGSDGYKLNFINISATSQFKFYDENGVEIEDVFDPEWEWSPKCKLTNGVCDSYLIQDNGYVMHLGKGEMIIADDTEDANSNRPISNKAFCKALKEAIEKANNIFFATYGLTKYKEIKDASDSRKVVLCYHGGFCYVLISITTSSAYFNVIRGTSSYMMYCDADDSGWYGVNYYLEQSTNKVTTLSESSTDTQYPSAKAVYDALQNVGGSSVFEAKYRETKYADILEAYNAKKHCLCVYNGQIYSLAVLKESGDTNAYFTLINNNYAYRVVCTTNDIWYNNLAELEIASNKTTSLSSESTDTQYPSAKAVYNALEEMKIEDYSNGNLKVSINGVSRDFMAATPSGDPMHYMYVTAGAEYNDTGADITRTGVYGDTIVWKAGYWWLNELGDITNEEMREIYLLGYKTISTNNINSHFQYASQIRTIMSLCRTESASHSENYTYMGATLLETINHQFSLSKTMLISTLNSMCQGCRSLRKILSVIDLTYATSLNRAFENTLLLEEVRIKTLKSAISFQDSPLLSNASILYMIENEAATSAIVITLHADAYARAMANEAITTALEAHPNVSLASA